MILNLFKPKWQHKNPQIRLKAVLEMDINKQETLQGIICNDQDAEVRWAALSFFYDYHLLANLAEKDKYDIAQQQIQEKIAELQLNSLLLTDDVTIKREILADIASEETLAIIVLEEKQPTIRLSAISKIDDQLILARLVEQNCGKEQGLAAIKKIDDLSLLQKAEKHASNRAVRSLALQLRQDIEGVDKQQNTNQTMDDNAKKMLCSISALQGLAINEAWAKLPALEQDWENLSPKSDAQVAQFNKIRDELVAAHHDCEDKQNGIIFETQKRIEQRLRLEEICEDIQRVWEKPWQLEELNKLKAEWENTAADTGYIAEVIKKRYRQRLNVFDSRYKIYQKEQDEDEQFTSTCAALLNDAKGGELMRALKKIGKLSDSVSGWEPRYHNKDKLLDEIQQATEFIEQNIQEATDKKSQHFGNNLAKRQQMIVQLQECVDSSDPTSQKEEVDLLLIQWTKPLRLAVDFEPLDKQFNELVEAFWQRFNEAGTKEDWQRWQNKNLKEELIVKVSNLDSVNDLHLVFKEIKAAQALWRKIGAVKQKYSNNLWQDFNQVCEDNFARCRKFFQELDAQALINLEKKQQLCEQAKLHEKSKEWRKSTEFIKDLQQKWREIGKVPKGQEQVFYKEFHKSCDVFFKLRSEHYQELDKKRQEHAAAKESLVAKVDKLSAKPDLAHKAKIIELQKEWRKVGSAPREQEDELWQHFRASCDKYFTWLDSLKPENLKQKVKLCEELELLTSDITTERIDEVRSGIIALQKRWKGIGPVPDDQHDAIWQRFRKPSDDYFTARRLEEEVVDRLRPENESRKNEILTQLKEYAARNDKKSVAGIMALQEKWKKLGPAGKDADWKLQKEFKELCNHFFKQRRESYAEMDRVRMQNLKQKESLCVRLEVFSGITAGSPKRGSSGGNQTLTLAEQLKLAFESNFVAAGDKTEGGRHKREEVEQIKEEWEKTGPVPIEHEHFIKKRYQKAMKAFHAAAAKQ